jgi:glycosyltransferase involved in cell wall biosynthesis
MKAARLLTVIPQFPLDTASGAAVSVRTTCEMLARDGWRVKVIATTASESHDPVDPRRALESFGIVCQTDQPAAPPPGSIHRFTRRAVDYELLDTGATPINEARRSFASNLDEMVSREVAAGVPDVLLTFGSSEAEVRRRRAVKEAGARVVFSLHNTAYRHERSFAATDAIVTPSRFLSEFYRQSHGVDSVPLPLPVWPEDVVAPHREPAFFTFVNPSLEKGLLFFLRLVQECARQHIPIPFLVVEARGSAALVARTAQSIGLDLRDVPNLQVVRATPDPARIYAVTKVLLVPSVEQEASGRVVVEAQLNGIPVIASDLGGLPETVGSGGYVLPVGGFPDRPETWEPAPEIVGPWVELMNRLQHDEAFLQGACQAASEAVADHRSGAAALRRVEFFRTLAGIDSRSAG